MNGAAIGLLVFACTFGGALAGIWLRSALPGHHLSGDSRTTINVGAGLIATLTALVLGLVTASAKESFDAVDNGIEATSSQILSLDRTLARYGPETRTVRDALKNTVAARVALLWPDQAGRAAELDPGSTGRLAEHLASEIRALSPQSADQRWLRARAIERCEALLDSRWMVVSVIGESAPVPFLVILLFWLTITFTSFGLFAPANATVLAALLVCALSVAGSVFLILELAGPFDGLITVSSEPLRYALAHLAL